MSITQPTLTKNSGFTFIGMVVVVSVLAMLAGILLPRYASVSEETVPSVEDTVNLKHNSRRVADIMAIKSALAVYKIINGHYPDTNNTWQGDAPEYGSFAYDATGYIPGLAPDFLPALPKDPAPEFPNTTTGGYMYRSDGVDYKFVVNGSPESYPDGNPFFDPTRAATAWQVSTADAHNW